MDRGLRSFGAALFARQLNLTQEEAAEMCTQAFKEFSTRSVHTYF